MDRYYDMHVHSHNSHDSNSKISDIVKHCIEKNISAVAITDHCDVQYFIEQNAEEKIKKSVEEVIAANDKFKGKVEILRGIEIGEGIWDEENAMSILNKYEYDVVIGSVHAVRYKNYRDPYSCIDFSELSLQETDEYLDKYFDEVWEMLHKIPCDIMAHLTCPLRYINGKYHRGVNLLKYREKILKILKYIIDNKISMEINTSGVCNEEVEFMPEEWIIKEFGDLGGELVTIGSDAHIPEKVAGDFSKAVEILRKHGFTKYYYYKNREAIPCEI